MVKKDYIFDTVLESVGNNGPFQRHFNYLYNLLFAIVAAMPVMNIVLALSVPDHWCHVPGRENTNYTIEEWRNLTLPIVINNKGQEAPSSCEMYSISNLSDVQPVYNYSTIKCQYGYDYDKTWYQNTVPSQEDWVCDKELQVMNIFVICRLGDIIGALIFGQLADYFGRKPIFFVNLIILIIGKIMLLFLTKLYYWYVLGALILSTTPLMLYQTVLVIGMEISSNKENSHIAMLQGIGWTLGISLLPGIYWWLQDWFYYMLISSLPMLLFLINNRYMIESPRWLANRGKIEECETLLRKIAKVNNTTLNDDALDLLRQDRSEPEKIYGLASLLSHWRLAKNALALGTCWIVSGIATFVLMLNAAYMDGNPFLNFFYQSIAELPSLFLGKWATNILGRKWSAVIAFAFAAISAIPLLFTSPDPLLHMYTTALTVLIKFFISVAFYVMHIQGVEIYPTCLRQTGIGLGIIAGNSFGVLGPYVVYLGTAYDVRYPYLILILMMLAGLVAELILPETLYNKLPETLAEAQNFGRNQNFWQLPMKPAQFFKDSLQKDTELQTVE